LLNKGIVQNVLFIFHWAIYTLNKTLPLDRERSQKVGEGYLCPKVGELEPRCGRVALNFDSRSGGIEATGRRPLEQSCMEG